MLKTVLAIFIILHGLVHAILAVAPDPADPEARPGSFFTTVERSWLLPKLGLSASMVQAIGILLVVVSTLGFVLTGLGIFGVAGLGSIWRSVAIISASISLLHLILFWHQWLLVGMLIDVVILVDLIWTKWLPINGV
jgi:hypothetical protein